MSRHNAGEVPERPGSLVIAVSVPTGRGTGARVSVKIRRALAGRRQGTKPAALLKLALFLAALVGC